MKINFVALVTGVILAVGLGYSGMTQPEKVFNFFNMFGEWDPAMMFVVISAIGSHMILFRVIMKRTSPLFAPTFQVPGQGKIDVKLALGATIFGTGWAITGFCPAPAFVTLVSFSSYTIIFLVTVTAGIYITKAVLTQLEKSA